MPGKLDSNLRSGNYHEELGVLLLRSFCAVAPIPRTEDIGVDVVATLLERKNTRVLIAKDSFLVQLKASSVRSILYDGDSLDWLLNLKIPFFIGSVNIKQSSLSIYTTHRVKVYGGSETRLELQLKECRKGKGYVLIPRKFWYKNTYDKSIIYLGEPIAVLSLSNMADWLTGNRLYSLMKKWIEVEERTINTLNTGYSREYLWRTGHAPIPWQESFEGSGEQYFKPILTKLEAPLEALSFHIFAELTIAERKLLVAFLKLLERYGDGSKFGRMAIRIIEANGGR